jgi:hypothetical protein
MSNHDFVKSLRAYQRSDCKWLAYDFIFRDHSRETGKADVLIKRADYYGPCAITEMFLKASLEPRDKIADLNGFSPNGHNPLPQWENRGVGTKALNIIIDDARKENVKLIYSLTVSTEKLGRFLARRGFKEDIGLYKLI